MPLIIPLRANNAYIGLGKQSVSGTAVAPTLFPRWLDGTMLQIEMKAEDIWEGDTTRHLSQVIKNQQSVSVKLTCYPRPVEMGFLETAALGVGGDSVTPATVNTTLSASTSIGATAITVASNTGLSGSGTISLVIQPGLGTEEVALFNIPATGVGPYTLTVNSGYNSGALKTAHTNSSVVQSATTHTITDQYDGNYYTLEVGLGSLNGGAGTSFRVRDCKVETIKRSSKAGMLLQYEVDFIGIASTTVSPATVTLENHQPFYFVTGTWTLDGSTSGDAPNVETFDITQKNALDTTIQTEQLNLAATIFGQLTCEVQYEVVFQNANRIFQTYYGSTSGTADAQAIGTGALSLIFAQVDGFHTVTYVVPTIHYTKIGFPAPKADGKHFKLAVTGSSVSNQGANTFVVESIVQNTQTAAY